jgi:hypothetical protein
VISDDSRKFVLTNFDILGLDEKKVRDLVVKCFCHAQQETFKKARKTLGYSYEFTELQKSVTSAVKLAFKKTGHDFEEPTREALVEVIDTLAEDARAMGTPESIISHHKKEIQKVLDRI